MSAPPSRLRPVRFGARALGGVALAAALLVSGCGGDSGGDATTSAPASAPPATATQAAGGALSHADLVAQADAACAKASAAISALPPARSLSALADYAAEVRRIGTDLRDQLGALTPSADDREAYTTYLDGLDASNAALDAMRTAAQAGDRDGVRAAAETIDQTAVGVLATRAGLAGCAATVTDEAS